MDDESGNSSISITQWMHQAVIGDSEAQANLWNRYFDRLLGIAKNRLNTGDRRVSDEEDVVLEAFNAFFQKFDKSNFCDGANRDDLWRILVAITERKALDQVRNKQRLKRGGGQVLGHSFAGSQEDGFQRIPDPSPEFADAFSLTCEHLLNGLNEQQRFIAYRKLAGYSNREIAEELGCVEEAVRRKVQLIRQLWDGHSKD